MGLALGASLLSRRRRRGCTGPRRKSQPRFPNRELASMAKEKKRKKDKHKKEKKHKSKKDKAGGPSAPVDKRVWIAKGKVIPESERALLRPHAEQKKIITNFKKQMRGPGSKGSPEPAAAGSAAAAAPSS